MNNNKTLEEDLKLLKKILKEILVQKIDALKKGLRKRYENKKKQFIYSEAFSEELLFYLALTSSLESKLGKVLNKFLIETLKHKELANKFGWMSIEDIQTNFHSLIVIDEEDFLLKKINKKIDLILIKKSNPEIYLFEIKSGGLLDNKKGEKEIEILKKIQKSAKHLFPEYEIFSCFGTIYNPRGEDSNWHPNFARELNEQCIKIGKNFWEFFFQEKIEFSKFTKDVYKKAFQELNFEKTITELKIEILGRKE